MADDQYNLTLSWNELVSLRNMLSDIDRDSGWDLNDFTQRVCDAVEEGFSKPIEYPRTGEPPRCGNVRMHSGEEMRCLYDLGHEGQHGSNFLRWQGPAEEMVRVLVRHLLVGDRVVRACGPYADCAKLIGKKEQLNDGVRLSFSVGPDVIRHKDECITVYTPRPICEHPDSKVTTGPADAVGEGAQSCECGAERPSERYEWRELILLPVNDRP